MKNRSTQVALLLMLAISVFASCDNTKNENKQKRKKKTAVRQWIDKIQYTFKRICDKIKKLIQIKDIPDEKIKDIFYFSQTM